MPSGEDGSGREVGEPARPEAGQSVVRLAHELGGPLPGALHTLDPDHLDHLADAIAHARRRQAAELAQAGERGLRFVPRLLRGPLRKVLG